MVQIKTSYTALLRINLPVCLCGTCSLSCTCISSEDEEDDILGVVDIYTIYSFGNMYYFSHK